MHSFLRHSFRLWTRTPLVAATIIFTLAIAIGANTAVFSVLRAVLLDPLPYPDSSRLAILWTEDPAHDVHQEGVSYPNYADWRSMNHTFTEMSFFVRTTYSQFNLGGSQVPERVHGSFTSSTLLPVIGVAPIRGRFFTEEEVKTRANVVVLGAGLALRHFATVDLAGRSIEIDGQPATVVGVMPAGFHFPDVDSEIWQPYTQLLPYQWPKRDSDALCVLGRLKPNVPIAQARADMASVGKRMEQAYPNMPHSFAGFGVNVVPLYEHVYGTGTRPALLLITGVAFCVLLIAVTNLANLLLARVESRDREFAVRAALGAGSSRLTRQVLAEVGVLSIIGALLGIVFAAAGLRILIAAFADRLPRLDRAALDWRMLVFAAAITTCACIFAALAPLSQFQRDQFASAIRKRASSPLKRTLAVAQVALATGLLGAAGLLVRSYTLANQTNLGYNPDHLLVFELTTRAAGMKSQQEAAAYGARVAKQVRERISALPGVIGVATAGDLLLARNPDWDIRIDGKVIGSDESPLGDDIVSPDFFKVMGTPLLAGRFFTEREQSGAMLINQAMSQRYWPGQDPVGRRFDILYGDGKWRERKVVGVVGNMRLKNREAAPIPMMYAPIGDYPDRQFIVRTGVNPAALIETIRREIRKLDQAAVVYRPRSMEAQLDNWMSPRRLNTSVVSVFSGIAALLAAVGIFSLLHYAAALRTREFGVRFALGATPAGVLALVVRDGVALATLGALLGAAAAIAAARIFSTLLFGVRPWDLEALAAAVIAAIVLAALASVLPAVRAARVNPMQALRAE